MALEEAKRRVAEGRRDREHRERAAVVGEALDVGDERAAALVEQAERPIDVLDLQHDGADALGVLAQVAPGAPAVAHGLVHHERRVARAERRRPLAAVPLELGPAAAQLGEVELVDEEAPRAFEVVDVVVQRLDPPDAERCGAGHTSILPPRGQPVAMRVAGAVRPVRSQRRRRGDAHETQQQTRSSASWPRWAGGRPSHRNPHRRQFRRPGPPGPRRGRGLCSGSSTSAAIPNDRTAATASNHSTVADWFSLSPTHQRIARADSQDEAALPDHGRLRLGTWSRTARFGRPRLSRNAVHLNARTPGRQDLV